MKLDWEKYGYVVASKYRMQILISLKDGPLTPSQIAKRTGLYLSHISLVLKDLVEKDVLTILTPNLRKGRMYGLTELGKDILSRIMKNSSSEVSDEELRREQEALKANKFVSGWVEKSGFVA